MTDRYITVHKSPKGPGDSRPTALQIIKNEGLEGKLGGQVALVTGCSSGIGIDTARALHAAGVTLYLTARNLKKARAALGDLVNDERVNLLELDLESFDSVRSCAAEFLSKSKTLNILICSAGVMRPPEGRTKDGFETQFGTNHLAHFLLFRLLKQALLTSATSGISSRVVIVSSMAHRAGTVKFENINFEGCYDALAAYAQSKTANIWMANEIERRYGARGIHAWSVHPGFVLTDLLRHASDERKEGINKDEALALMFKNSAQGAATSVWAATSASLEGKGGKYLDDCRIAELWNASQGPRAAGYEHHAYDEEAAIRLWEESIKWVGL